MESVRASGWEREGGGVNPVVSLCYQKTGPRRYCWKGPFCRELFVQLLLLCLQLLIVLGSHPVCLDEFPLLVSGPAPSGLPYSVGFLYACEFTGWGWQAKG